MIVAAGAAWKAARRVMPPLSVLAPGVGKGTSANAPVSTGALAEPALESDNIF